MGDFVFVLCVFWKWVSVVFVLVRVGGFGGSKGVKVCIDLFKFRVYVLSLFIFF